MTRGTLVLSRDVFLHSHYKARLEAMGFENVTVTATDGNELNKLINDLKPRLVLADCNFHYCATPYMMGLLLKKYPDLNIAAVSFGPYPADRFIDNGINSCVCYLDGDEQFYQGLECVRDGKEYVSRSVQERIEARLEYPKFSGKLTARHIEIIRLLCNGFKADEIVEILHISISTVDKHKTAIYKKLNVRNENELIRAALCLGIIEKDELNFFGGDYDLMPEQEKKTTVRRIV
jgi:DNA-binding NarL/FixJ family response regulator